MNSTSLLFTHSCYSRNMILAQNYSSLYLYLEVEVLFCRVEFCAQFIGRSLFSGQVLPSVLRFHYMTLAMQSVDIWD